MKSPPSADIFFTGTFEFVEVTLTVSVSRPAFGTVTS